MNNYKVVIAYDGTNYSGWQVQPNGVTVQELIQKALKTLVRQEVTLIGSGRTDAGVHAVGQTANFKCERDIDKTRFLYSLNGLLPRDIRVLSVNQVPIDFHSQYSATGKIYHYHLQLDPVQDPFKRLYSYHVLEKCSLELLHEGARYFLGTHDFSSFANDASEGSAAKDPVRTIKRLVVVEEKGGARLEFEADGFLYKMVRNMVGTLVEVGTGKRAPADILAILTARDRRQAGLAAPPQGLFLIEVHY